MSAFAPPEYSPPLSPDRLAVVMNAIDFRIYGGTHGFSVGEDTDGAPIPIEYDAAAGIVENLAPNRGDILFIEDPGRRRPLEFAASLTELGEKDFSAMANLQRYHSSISAFGYAAMQAIRRRIPVVSADISTEEEAAFRAAMQVSPNDDAREQLAAMYDTTRERAAIHTVLKHAQKVIDGPVSSERPQYSLLFGTWHIATGGLARACQYHGLAPEDYKSYLLPSRFIESTIEFKYLEN